MVMKQTNILTRYKDIETHKARLEAELEALREDPRLQAEMEFQGKLEALMSEYQKSAREVLALLDPNDTGNQVQPQGQRRKRKLKVYRNPSTGEEIETRGGNHKILKVWKDQYGNDVVEGWLIREED